MLKMLSILSLLSFSLHAASIKLINDSPFPLSATILSATGEVMGRQVLQPQQQVSWQNSDLDVNKNSQSPFTVIFYCQTGEVYGTVTGIGSAGMVQASTASGPRFCKPKDDKKGKEEQEKSDLQYQPHPINPGQWKQEQRY